MRLAPLVCLAASALLALSLGSCASSDSGSSVPNCKNGEKAGKFDSDVPAWIQDNFTCVKVTMDGDDIVIETYDLPPYTSYYWGENSKRYDDTVPDTPNPNTIEKQDVIMTVTSSPEEANSSPEAGLGIVGIAVDGTVIFNDEAAPGDKLQDELDTFDVNDGHPTSSGVYHYHSEPGQITSNDDVLVGIAIDGFPIFGRKDQDGNKVVAKGNNWHTKNDTDLFSDHTPHYHIVYNNSKTQSDGDIVQVRYMIGTNLGGTAGTVEGDESGN